MVAASSFRFLPKIASRCQRSFQPMMRRKFLSVARNEAATQRSTIEASRQRHTWRVRIRTPDCGLSITLVVARQRCSDGGIPSRLMVKHSSSPSASPLCGHRRICIRHPLSRPFIDSKGSPIGPYTAGDPAIENGRRNGVRHLNSPSARELHLRGRR